MLGAYNMKRVVFFIAISLATQQVYAAEKLVELTAAELSVFQSKSYENSVTTAFTATISTMQSLGYLNINGNRETGTISGETESKGKIIYNILWGVGKKKQTLLASLFLEQISPTRTTVKLNLTMNEAKSRGLFGNAFKDGIIIKEAAPYQQFYAALDSEMARRALPTADFTTSSQPMTEMKAPETTPTVVEISSPK